MKSAEILFYSELEFGGAEALVAQIRAAGSKPILLRINSPGGSVFDGYAVYNALLTHKPGVSVVIDGLAASVASYIAMAGKRVEMSENALLMIHNPTAFVGGEADDLRKRADMLDKIKESVVDAYARKAGTKVSRNEIALMMDAETWLTADAAVERGFVDAVVPAMAAAACAKFDTSKFRNAPPQAANHMKILTASIATLLATACGASLTENSTEADVQGAVNKLTGERDQFKLDLAAANTAKGTAETALAAMTTEMASLKTQFAAMETAATDAKNKLAAEEAKVTNLTSELSGVKASLVTAEGHKARLEKLCAVKGIDPNAAPPKVDEPTDDRAALRARMNASTDPTERTNLARQIRDFGKAK